MTYFVPPYVPVISLSAVHTRCVIRMQGMRGATVEDCGIGKGRLDGQPPRALPLNRPKNRRMSISRSAPPAAYGASELWFCPSSMQSAPPRLSCGTQTVTVPVHTPPTPSSASNVMR